MSALVAKSRVFGFLLVLMLVPRLNSLHVFEGPGDTSRIRCGSVADNKLIQEVTKRYFQGNSSSFESRIFQSLMQGDIGDKFAHFSFDRNLTKNEDPVQFIHIPKTAGTSIEKAGFQRGHLWGAAARYHLECVDNQIIPWQHVPPDDLTRLGWTNPYLAAKHTFCVVRDPYERLLSTYRFAMSTEEKHMRVAFSLSADGWSLLRDGGCSVDKLNRFVRQALRRVRKKQNKYELYAFLLPQSKYIFGKERQWCTDILHMDTLPDAFDNLMTKYGYNFSMGKPRNKATGCNVTTHDLSPHSLKMINDYYAEDFERLNFSKIVPPEGLDSE